METKVQSCMVWSDIQSRSELITVVK